MESKTPWGVSLETGIWWYKAVLDSSFAQNDKDVWNSHTRGELRNMLGDTISPGVLRWSLVGLIQRRWHCHSKQRGMHFITLVPEAKVRAWERCCCHIPQFLSAQAFLRVGVGWGTMRTCQESKRDCYSPPITEGENWKFGARDILASAILPPLPTVCSLAMGIGLRKHDCLDNLR